MARSSTGIARFGRWVGMLSIVASATWTSSSALAGDLKTMDEALKAYAATDAAVREHIKGKALEALKSDVAEILKTRAGLDPKLVEKYDALLGTIMKGTTDDGVQKVVLKAIGETKNASLFLYVRPFLVQPDKASIPPLLQDAIETTSALAAEDGIPLLLNVVKDSKNYAIAAVALKALGVYGSSKTQRQNVLRDVVLTVKKDQPSVGLRYKNDDGSGPYATAKTKTGDETVARYGALSPVMVEALNKLTGQKCGTAEDWFSLYDKYKGSLGELFPSSK